MRILFYIFILMVLQVLGGSGSSIGHALDLNYTYTPRGMVEAMNDNVDVTNNRFYEYDAQGRLETASGPWGSGSFTYDSLGNIRAKALGSRNITLDYADGNNRVTKSTDSGDTGIRNLTYDDRGNVEYLGEQRFLYTATDRPRVRRSTGAGNGYGKYRYDGHGRRISAWEREDGEWAYRYNAYDASGALVFIVEEENQFPYNDTITHYVKQDGQTVARVKSTSLNSAPEITWLHHDHLGSAVAGTKADGTTAWTEKYTPFGISMVNAADNDNQAGFTGHIKDSDTGLTYMQARYYDPVIGRFLSHDPVGFMDTGEPGMFNRYSYTLNDPVNLTDPDGRCAVGSGLPCPTNNNWTNDKEARKQRKGAEADFIKSYRNMRKADVIGADLYFHCEANCKATRRGPAGEEHAKRISDMREIIDQAIKGDPAEASEADQVANEAGRSGANDNPNQTCSEVCSSFIPNGLGEEYTGIPEPEPEPEPEPNREEH